MQNSDAAHRRRNPLINEWVLVSPHRNNRPWQGASETSIELALPNYVESCPLCAGNTRANGETNDNYSSTFVFTNDFAALTPNAINETHEHPLYESCAATGLARVICFSPEHNQTLAMMTPIQIQAVVDTWQSQYIELAKHYNCVHIFENKGDIMGCSQPHPHGQIWAHQHYSTEIEKENHALLQYYTNNHSDMLGDIVKQEQKDNERIIAENADWLVVVPYWAKWPFETLLIAKHPVADFSQLTQAMKASLAMIISVLTIKYDNIFECSFAYSMGWHCAPSDLDDKSHWRLHAHFYPPLLRSASVKKHMVGYEMLAEAQRDITAEQAATILQNASDVHYKNVR